jgi:mannan endo-1,4-beta-mannosidase
VFGNHYLIIFLKEKNLHNLLYIFAPDQSAPTPSMYYPGDDYVDIVALDVYIDDPVILTFCYNI